MVTFVSLKEDFNHIFLNKIKILKIHNPGQMLVFNKILNDFIF